MKKIINIHIGGCHASAEPVIISTILGSCVAVCIYDPVRQIGGMNHILLPGKADLRNYDNPTRFGINAMELLINSLMKLGARRSNFTAKVFGGAKVLSVLYEENQIGLKNAEFVKNYLINENIKLINYNIGGVDSRRIYFHTDNGDIFLRRVKSNQTLETNGIKEKVLLNEYKNISLIPGKIVFFD